MIESHVLGRMEYWRYLCTIHRRRLFSICVSSPRTKYTVEPKDKRLKNCYGLGVYRHCPLGGCYYTPILPRNRSNELLYCTYSGSVRTFVSIDRPRKHAGTTRMRLGCTRNTVTYGRHAPATVQGANNGLGRHGGRRSSNE